MSLVTILQTGNHVFHQKRCNQVGGRLAIIKNEDVNKKMKAAILKHARTKDQIFYMGLIMPLETTYLWLNGEPVRYTNWFPEQPDVKNTCEFCGEAYLRNGKIGWNDIPCVAPQKRYGMCEVRKHVPRTLIGTQVTEAEDIQWGGVIFHQRENENVVELRGMLLLARKSNEFLKAVIVPDGKFCKYRKLPDNLAFKDISFNLGTFPYVPLTQIQYRMDILRYLPGTNTTQILNSYFLIMKPDNSILGCHKIRQLNAFDFYIAHNNKLTSILWGRLSKLMMVDYHTRCFKKNLARGRLGYVVKVKNV